MPLAWTDLVNVVRRMRLLGFNAIRIPFSFKVCIPSPPPAGQPPLPSTPPAALVMVLPPAQPLQRRAFAHVCLRSDARALRAVLRADVFLCHARLQQLYNVKPKDFRVNKCPTVNAEDILNGLTDPRAPNAGVHPT